MGSARGRTCEGVFVGLHGKSADADGGAGTRSSMNMSATLFRIRRLSSECGSMRKRASSTFTL